MSDPVGAFHAAEDADSLPEENSAHKREGAYWTWRAERIRELLDPRDAAIFCAAYGIQPEGNARPESDPHGELEGANTLFRASNPEDLAKTFGATAAEIGGRLESARRLLLADRRQRPKPHRDDKIVTAWNGLVIGALARGGRIFGDARWVAAALDAVGFLKRELWDGKTLFRSFRGHRSKVGGFPADYAFLISGLIELQSVVPGGGWLEWAVELQRTLDAEYWDAGEAGYVLKPALAGETLLAIREDYDGAEPSPNHVAAENLLKLAELCNEPAYAKRAEALLRAGSRILETRPFGAPVLLAALDLHDRGVMKFQLPEGNVPEALRNKHLPRAIFTAGPSGEVLLCERQTCRIWAP